MPESRASSGFAENRTASDSEACPRPIQDKESDAFVARLKEVIGGESKSSFSRRCGFKESVLRGYLVDGKKPGLDYLVAMANAASVTVEWLATGKLPKTRAEQRVAQGQAQYLVGGEAPPPARIDYPLLRQCLGACNIVYGDAFAAAAVARQLEHVVDLYNALLPNVGPRLSLEDIARREARGLAEMLRGFIAIGAVRPFE